MALLALSSWATTRFGPNGAEYRTMLTGTDSAALAWRTKGLPQELPSGHLQRLGDVE